MAGSCVGFNETATAMCEACRAEGGTWVIRPDGTYICSKHSWPEQAGLTPSRKALSFLAGFAVVLLGNALWKQYRKGKGNED